MNFAFKLLDAEVLRRLLGSARGPLQLCVSEVVYRQVIEQRHEGLDPEQVEAAWLDAKGQREIAWVRAPGDPGLVARTGLSVSDVAAHNGGRRFQ